uniref:Ubiquitin carboxyl-terminal hydrolase n=1 Tax=Elaeophora elaphi TaxID=1147741 RepID=A0A0R3S6Q2_9BILA
MGIPCERCGRKSVAYLCPYCLTSLVPKDIADVYSMANKNESGSETGEQSVGNESCVYYIKWVDVEGVEYAVVMQNENGPCPLLAVINVLLLRGRDIYNDIKIMIFYSFYKICNFSGSCIRYSDWLKFYLHFRIFTGQITLPCGSTEVSEKKLLQFVADCILRLKPKDIDEAELPNYEQNVSDVLTLIPSLPKGLDVNIHFTGVRKFEYTSACALFDILNIPLVHGWIIDQTDQELLKVVDGLSYNRVVEKIVSANNESENYMLRKFLDSSASQLTTQGIAELLSNLNDGEIAVLFRNNHFQTLAKQKDALYVLVTDMGFLGESAVVWETLDCIDGNSTFVNSVFSTSHKLSILADESADYLLALSIQEAEKESIQNRSTHMSGINLSAEECDVQHEVPPRVRALPSSTQAVRSSKNYNVRSF